LAKPEKHVFVCIQNRGPGHPRGSCMQSGATNVWEEFAYAFQQKNLNGRFALSNTGCLGPCNGPHVLVYPEGVMYGNVGKDDVAAIVEEHLVGDKPVERLMVPPGVWD
jgi:(2Fe-2S) ferredoxin